MSKFCVYGPSLMNCALFLHAENSLKLICHSVCIVINEWIINENVNILFSFKTLILILISYYRINFQSQLEKLLRKNAAVMQKKVFPTFKHFKKSYKGASLAIKK